MAEIDKKASSTRYWRAKEPGLWGSIKHFFLVDREGFKPVKNEHGEYFYTPCKTEFDSEEERLADFK